MSLLNRPEKYTNAATTTLVYFSPRRCPAGTVRAAHQCSADRQGVLLVAISGMGQPIRPTPPDR